MPIYEYRCDNGHTFEVMQKMTDDPVATCQTCDAPVQRVFHPVAVHFKGKGFYNTDYGKKSRAAKSDSGGESVAEGSATSATKADSSTDSSADSSKPKADSKPAAGSD